MRPQKGNEALWNNLTNANKQTKDRIKKGQGEHCTEIPQLRRKRKGYTAIVLSQVDMCNHIISYIHKLS